MFLEMADLYFHVTRDNNPNENGLVIRMNDRALSTFAGDSSPDELGFKVDLNGKLFVGPHYFYALISENTAKELRKSYGLNLLRSLIRDPIFGEIFSPHLQGEH